VNGLLQQNGIGADDLLAAQAAQARGLQANMLDRAGDIAEYNKIAVLERLIEADPSEAKTSLSTV